MKTNNAMYNLITHQKNYIKCKYYEIVLVAGNQPASARGDSGMEP